MKIIFILILLFNGVAETPDANYLRNLFAGATQNEAKARQLIEATENEMSSSVVKGYCGAGKIIMANHYFNPVSKYNSFTKGKKLLEAAIHSDSSNAELRYLRLSIQRNAPSFLGYNRNIEQDNLFLNNSLSAIKDEQLKLIIGNYLKTI